MSRSMTAQQQARQDARDQIMTAGGVKWYRRNETDPNVPEYGGGTSLFNELDAATLQTLVAAGFADSDDTQNDGPSLGEVAAFLAVHPRFRAEGYVVSMERPDARVTVTGVTLAEEPTPEELAAFREVLKGADEYEENEPGESKYRLRAWFD